VVAWFVTTASPVGAVVSGSATVDPAEWTFPATKQATFRLGLRNDGAPQSFAIEMNPSFYAYDAAGRVLEGSPLGPTLSIANEGQLSFGLLGRSEIGLPGCSPRENRYHGYEHEKSVVDVSMPADSVGTLVVRREWGEHAPWPGSDLRLAFRLSNDLVGPGTGTLDREQDVLPPAPVRRGPTGVRIRFETRPASRDPGPAAPPEIAAGTPIAVTGTTDPPLAGARIALRFYGPENDRTRTTLAVVETDDAGHFGVAGWRPAAAGEYELWAFYSADRPGVVDDYACPRTFRQAGTYQPPPSPGRLRVRSRAAHLTARSSVPLRATCVGGGECTARLALSVPARALGEHSARPVALGKRKVGLGRGLSQRFEIAVDRRWRAPVRRAKRLTVTVTGASSRRTIVLRP
jgi:hypothetical protein